VLRFHRVVHVELQQPATGLKRDFVALVGIADKEPSRGNFESDFIRETVNPLERHPDIKCDVSLALVDGSGMKDQDGNMGSRGEHRAVAVVEVDVGARSAIGVVDVDGTPSSTGGPGVRVDLLP